jgi:hypothetical protein
MPQCQSTCTKWLNMVLSDIQHGKGPDETISNLVNSLCLALGIHQFVYSQQVAQQSILEEAPSNVITSAEVTVAHEEI